MLSIKSITVLVFLAILAAISTGYPQDNARFLGGGHGLSKFFAPFKFAGLGAGLGGGVNGHAGTYTIQGVYGGANAGVGLGGLGGYGGGLQSLLG